MKKNKKTLHPSMYRSDGTIKSAIGWKGPIKNNITGDTMTELSIGAPGSEEGFYPLMNPYMTDEQIEFIKNINLKGNAEVLGETPEGRALRATARRHYEESLKKGISPFVSYTSDPEEAKKADEEMKKELIRQQEAKDANVPKLQEGGFIDMQDDVPEGTGTTGANITFEEPQVTTPEGDQGMITSTDSGVRRDEVPSNIDTSEGFYSVNPAPGESAAGFAERNPLPTLEEQFPDPAPEDPNAYRPDEGYVSPRITTTVEDITGYSPEGSGDMGDATDPLVDQLTDSAGTGPSDDDIAYTDPGLVSAVNTIENVITGSTAADMVSEALDTTKGNVPEGWSLDGYIEFIAAANPIYYGDGTPQIGPDGTFGLINEDGTPNFQSEIFTTNVPNLSFVDAKTGAVFTYGDRAPNEDDLAFDIRYMTKEEAISQAELFNNWDDISANKTFQFTATPGRLSLDEISKATGLSKEVIVARNEQLFKDKYGVTVDNVGGLGSLNLNENETLTLPERLKRSPFKQKLDSMGDWFTEIKNTQLGSLPGETRITLGNIADDMFAGLAAGFLTPDGKFDAEKFAIAGAGSFAKTNVVDAFSSKAVIETLASGGISVADIASKINVNITDLAADKAIDAIMLSENYDKLSNDAKNLVESANTASKHMKAIGGAAASAITTLALGGTAEDAVKAGALTAGGVYGAEYLVKDVGMPAGPAGAIIGAALAVLQGGGAEEVGKGATYGYMLSNPATAPFAYALMAVEFILGMKKPSNKTAYYTFDLDDFEGLSFSQGDYDPDKANESNVEFIKGIGEPLLPIVKGLEETSGMNLIGDLQFHYGGRDGLYYTIGSRDISGTPEEMFLNRLDYFDGKDQSTADGGSVYRSRRFSADKSGISQMYKELLGELSYIVKNNITDLSGYTGKKLSLEETKELLSRTTNAGIPNVGLKKGGKTLDKNTKVLYNSNQAKNYGLVDRKGKAPPSARADDVPMTLKEGDFVLSQPAVALYGEDTINRMVQRAANEAGTNLKSGGKVPVNVHNGEYIIPKKLTEYIGSNVLENMNNRGLMSVGERPNT
jgi:hypothetical protein